MTDDRGSGGGVRLTLKELPAGERPRERLLHHGAAALSDAELLAILIRTGDAASGRTAVDLARDLLVRAAAGTGADAVREARSPGDGLRFLVTATVEELSRVKGIGPAKAVQLKAAVEIGRRLAAGGDPRREVRNPVDLCDLLMAEMRYLEQEQFRAVLLDTKSRVISVELVSVGGLDTSSAHPREVFKAPIRKNAAALILVHNHPSGDPAPSPEDMAVTRRLAEAGRILGIEVLDHLIIGDNRYVSFKQCGMTF